MLRKQLRSNCYNRLKIHKNQKDETKLFEKKRRKKRSPKTKFCDALCLSTASAHSNLMSLKALTELALISHSEIVSQKLAYRK